MSKIGAVDGDKLLDLAWQKTQKYKPFVIDPYWLRKTMLSFCRLSIQPKKKIDAAVKNLLDEDFCISKELRGTPTRLVMAHTLIWAFNLQPATLIGDADFGSEEQEEA